MPKFTIAIVGAGLTGLFLAIALDKYAPDIDYRIYESAAELTTAGAGIVLPPRSWYTLQQIGVAQALLEIAGNAKKSKLTLLYRKSDQPVGYTFLTSDEAEDNFTFHRGELQKVLLEHMRHPERLRLGKRFVSYTQPADPSEPIEIRFQDGSAAQCDLLVGCDGVKSKVRVAMYTQLADAAQAAGRPDEEDALRSYGQAVFSGITLYRALAEVEKSNLSKSNALVMSHLILHCGKRKSIVAFPVHKGRWLNVAAVVANPQLQGTIYEGPWTAEVSKEEVSQEFSGWEPDAEAAMMAPDKWSKWAINIVKDLPTFVDGRVALVGDAAHAMAPHQGAGAGQGFEDCLVLAKLLSQTAVNVESTPVALKIYDEVRRPFAQSVAHVSLQSGHLHCFVGQEFPEMSSSGQDITRERLEEVGEVIERLKDWRRGTTIDKDCGEALCMLQEKLA